MQVDLSEMWRERGHFGPRHWPCNALSLKNHFGWNIFLKRKITEIKRMQVLAYDVVLNLVTQWGSCLYKFVLQMNHTYRFCAKVVYHGKEVTFKFSHQGFGFVKTENFIHKKGAKKSRLRTQRGGEGMVHL